MSTGVGVIRDGKIALAVESMACNGGDTKVDVGSAKLVRTRVGVFAVSGDLASGGLLRRYANGRDVPHSRDDVEQFVDGMLEYFEGHGLNPSAEGSWKLTPLWMLLATRFGLFEICEDRCVREVVGHAAVGSGAAYALGAIHAMILHGKELTAETMAKDAVSAAIAYDLYSGGSVYSEVVRLSEA